MTWVMETSQGRETLRAAGLRLAGAWVELQCGSHREEAKLLYCSVAFRVLARWIGKRYRTAIMLLSNASDGWKGQISPDPRHRSWPGRGVDKRHEVVV